MQTPFFMVPSDKAVQTEKLHQLITPEQLVCAKGIENGAPDFFLPMNIVRVP